MKKKGNGKKKKEKVEFPQKGALVFCRICQGWDTGCDIKFCMVS